MLKQVVSIATSLSLVAVAAFATFEPTQVVAQSDSDAVVVTLEVGEEISIDSPADVTMGSMSLSTNESTGQTTWTVITNADGGYTLGIDGGQTPALQGSGSNQFADYTEATPDTPETWSVSNAYEFGFSAHGTDVPDGIWGSGTDCGTNAATGGSSIDAANRLYQGFNGTTDIIIASSTSPTDASGTASTVCFAAEQETVVAPNDTYTATITATATVQ